MKKLIIIIMFIIILGLYFFTDQTKNALKKITGYIVDEGKEKIKDVVKEGINEVNMTKVKEGIKDLVKEEIK